MTHDLPVGTNTTTYHWKAYLLADAFEKVSNITWPLESYSGYVIGRTMINSRKELEDFFLEVLRRMDIEI